MVVVFKAASKQPFSRSASDDNDSKQKQELSVGAESMNLITKEKHK